ncbi:MAG: hypothetical protein H6994_01495 [Pseudomonadales bacterium]|nr:hypothetical protein [Pseudomonadales bacterium]
MPETRRTQNRLMRAGRALVVLSCTLFPCAVFAVNSQEESFPGESAELPPSQPVSFRSLSDEQLTRVGQRWELLSAPERRALLAEVTSRMARQNHGDGRFRIQVTRKFGVVRRADGTTYRVERRIIRVMPVAPDEGSGFGQAATRSGALPGESTSQPASAPARSTPFGVPAASDTRSAKGATR